MGYTLSKTFSKGGSIEYFQAILGLIVFIGIAWALSENKKAFPKKVVLTGLGLQFIIALCLLFVPGIKQVFLKVNDLALIINDVTNQGSHFMFGFLAGSPLPQEAANLGIGPVIAFQVLPIVLVTSAFSAVLFHWGILQKLVLGFAFVLRKFMGAGGAMGLGVASNIFLGIIEAPILIRPYLKQMSRSELFTLLTSGMATIAGTVLVLYATILKDSVPDALGQILLASLISAPAAILIAQIMIPQGRISDKAIDLSTEKETTSAFDALIKGTFDGLQMVLNIVAVIIVVFASVALINKGLGLVTISGKELSLQNLFGFVFTPITWLMGLSWQESLIAGPLMGTKTALNEFVAYSELARVHSGNLSEKSRVILTFAMCGFANFGSLGILVGGLGTILPERRQEILELGLKAILAGTLATCMTGSVIAIFI